MCQEKWNLQRVWYEDYQPTEHGWYTIVKINLEWNEHNKLYKTSISYKYDALHLVPQQRFWFFFLNILNQSSKISKIRKASLKALKEVLRVLNSLNLQSTLETFEEIIIH